ncbi:MAG: hypothetical protein ACOZF0_09955 [Thermodesulfobacteriota bacterium]
MTGLHTTSFTRSKIFFDRRDYELLGIVNRVLQKEAGHLDSQQIFYPYCHPHGIKEMAETRGLRFAYAIIRLLDSLEVGQMADRLSALRSLRNEMLSNESNTFQINTARVLLEIMKALIRAHGDEKRQLELAHDFRVAALGKPRIVRAFLKQYHLLEMPEEWTQLAFDDHVHDANTKGRKSPTHLIMDAWIKGIRRLRVIYYNHVWPHVAAELMEAAEITGITVRIGIEFSTRFYDQFVQLIWVPRGFADADDFIDFLNQDKVMELMAAGREASQFQQRAVLEVLAEINRHPLDILLSTHDIQLPRLDPQQFLQFVGTGQASLLHLAEYIHITLLPLMKKKVEELRSLYAGSDAEERKRINARVRELDALDAGVILEHLPCATGLHSQFGCAPPETMPIPAIMELSPCRLIDRLAELHSGYRITMNLTGVRGEDVLEILYECGGRITRLETFNLKNFAAGKNDHIAVICDLQKAMNDGNAMALKRLINDFIKNGSHLPAHRIARLKEIRNDIASLRVMYRIRPLKSRIGSDSTGRSSRFHGMGLAVVETLPRRSQRSIRKEKASLRQIIPIHVDTYPRTVYLPREDLSQRRRHFWDNLRHIPGVLQLRYRRRREWVAVEQSTRMSELGNIVTLGHLPMRSSNALAADLSRPVLRQQRPSLRYLNSNLKNIIKVLVGFVPAFATFFASYDWWLLAYFGAFIWFGITGLRNIIQSVLGGRGIRQSNLLRWNDFVSWDRLTDSLLYTGFSVPLLDFFIKKLVLAEGFDITTTTNPALLYACMALANGIYLTSHNLFRGLQKEAAAANFFRSIFSIPIAFAFNTLIGWLLSSSGVADVNGILQNWAAVISKAASDTVAGIIEGAADRAQNIRFRLADYQSKIRQFFDLFEQLEIHFTETSVDEILDDPGRWLTPSNPKEGELLKIMFINGLDLLYFWMYQPRARTAFRQILRRMSKEERNLLIRSQFVLKMEREISLLLIDGIIGRDFSRALSFYLTCERDYLASLERLEHKLSHTPVGSPD